MPSSSMIFIMMVRLICDLFSFGLGTVAVIV